MGSLYAALQRLLQFSRTSPGEERAGLMDWHLPVEPLDQHLDDHQQDHRADQQDPQDPFW